MALLDDVNSTDLVGAIRLGCRAMESVFNADDPRGVAFFDAVVRPLPRLAFSPVHSEAHVPGRHLNGLLAAEGLAGVEVDENAVRRHRAALLFSYSGDVPLPLNRERVDGPLAHFCQHNVREGFHGLAALIRWRADDEALALAIRSIDFISGHWQAPDIWSVPISPRDCQALTLVQGLGRAIGPLVKVWQATGHEPAIDLARRIADAVIDAFPPDGALRSDVLGTHTHSITSTLASLASLGDAQADRALLDRVRAFYGNGLWRIRDELGWALETTVPGASPDKGEGNASGDIVETGLILGRHGDPSADDDVERIVRAHLLPSQLRDVSWIPGSAGTDDGTRDVARRLRGAFGFAAPYGHDPLGLETIKFNLDIVGGVIASLAEVAAAAVDTTGVGADVRFLFDLERDGVRIRSPYGAGETVEVTAAGGVALRVRLPGWSATPGWHAVDAGPIRLVTPLPTTELRLRHRTRSIHARLRGDQIVAMEDVGARLRFFPAMR